MIRRVRKLVSLILRRTLITLIGWLFFIPLAYLIPQKKKSVVIFGREKFVDNLKYFFLYLCGLGTDEVKVSMLLKDKHTYQILKAKGLPVLFYPTPKSILETMRASMVIDAGTSLSGLGYYFSYRACTVMLWHGAGMKLTRKTDKIMGQSRLLNALYNIFRVQLPYDIFISTSAFYTEHVFSKNNKRAKIFRSQEILESGYPRNDCFFREIGPLELIGSDAEILQKAKDARADGCKIILYAPTFRDSGGDAIADGALDVKALSAFGQQHKYIFIFKHHPGVRNAAVVNELDFVWEYDRHSDVYPLMPYVDLLITDYSSIFTDFLLLDRPTVFFPYDYKKYTQKDRDIRFDYDWFTPGPKCYNQSELQETICQFLVKGEDAYRLKRREILDIAFDYKGGESSKLLWNLLKEKI